MLQRKTYVLSKRNFQILIGFLFLLRLKECENQGKLLLFLILESLNKRTGVSKNI